MTVPILCLVALALLCWVVLLKAENDKLAKELEALREEARKRRKAPGKAWRRNVDVDHSRF